MSDRENATDAGDTNILGFTRRNTGWRIMSVLFGIATLIALGIGVYQLSRNMQTNRLLLLQSEKLEDLENSICSSIQHV